MTELPSENKEILSIDKPVGSQEVFYYKYLETLYFKHQQASI